MLLKIRDKLSQINQEIQTYKYWRALRFAKEDDTSPFKPLEDKFLKKTHEDQFHFPKINKKAFWSLNYCPVQDLVLKPHKQKSYILVFFQNFFFYSWVRLNWCDQWHTGGSAHVSSLEQKRRKTENRGNIMQWSLKHMNKM
jgi:hypothetical protein